MGYLNSRELAASAVTPGRHPTQEAFSGTSHSCAAGYRRHLSGRSSVRGRSVGRWTASAPPPAGDWLCRGGSAPSGRFLSAAICEPGAQVAPGSRSPGVGGCARSVILPALCRPTKRNDW